MRVNIKHVLLAIFFTHVTVALLSFNGIVQDDATSYATLARNLVSGEGYVFQAGQTATSWRAPGYPVFLAMIWGVLGESETLARIANAFLWTGTAFFCSRIAAMTIGTNYTQITAIFIGFFPEFVGMSGLLWSESLFILLFMALHCGILNMGSTKSPGHWIGCGVILGFAILTRSTAIVMVPVIIGLAAYRRYQGSRAALLQATVVLAIGLGIMGSWTLRNYMTHGHFILVESNAGFNLYVGNSPDTPIPFAWKKLYNVSLDQVYEKLTTGKSEAEMDLALRRAAFQHMSDNPGKTIALGFGKLFDFWLPDFFIASNIRSKSFGEIFQPLWPLMLAITTSAFLLVGTSALRHVWLNFKQPHIVYFLSVLAIYTAPHTIVYGTSRYHMPLMPILIILAVPGLVDLYGYVFSKYKLRAGLLGNL